MRRFRFRLASLLRLRSQIERAARKDLALAMAEINGIDQQIDAAEQGLGEFAEQASRSDSVGELARSLESGLRRHRWTLVKKRAEAEKRLESVRTAYAQKAREKRTLERLRDQEQQAWREQTLRDEQAEMDELAGMQRQRARDQEEVTT